MKQGDRNKFLVWSRRLAEVLVDRNGFTISAQSVEGLSSATFHLLMWYHSESYDFGPPPQHQDLVFEHCGALPQSLLSRVAREFRIIDDKGTLTSLGLGLERSAYDHLIRTVVTDLNYWSQNGPWFVPVFSPIPGPLALRLQTWKALGTLCALYFLYYRVAPDPVSPFFILALLGMETFDALTLGQITAFDPDAADKLEGWLQLAPDCPLPPGFTPASQSIAHAEIPVSFAPLAFPTPLILLM